MRNQKILFNVDNTKQYKYQVLSLCTGYGGIELGLDIAGVEHRTVAYVEIEAFAIANLVAKMEAGALHPAPIWSNLKTFDARPFRRRVDLITGGYPCQPFSAAGQRKGSEDPRHLWPHIRAIVETIKPFRCFFENVEGHLTLGYDEVYRSLRDLGYKVEAGIFSSEETGGSHQRKRLFILAELGDTKCNYEGFSTEARHSIGTNEASKRLEQGWHEMADTNGTNDRRNTREVSSDKEKEWIPKRHENTKLIKSSQAMANDNSDGKREMEQESKSNSSDWTSQRMPVARVGVYQYPWEHPRQNTKDALKSTLGLPADGYDYRTDILRSLGNGVDPWTAAKAWEVLNSKLNHI